jgi:hypothetical protein
MSKRFNGTWHELQQKRLGLFTPLAGAGQDSAAAKASTHESALQEQWRI